MLRGWQCVTMHGLRHGKQKEKTYSTKEENVAVAPDQLSVEGGWVVTAFVSGVLIAVYMKTMYPSLPGGDAGELILAAHELGVAHPPGYPLYTMLLKLVMWGLPWGSAAWKANLVSAVCAAAAGGILFRTVYLLTGCLAPGLLAAGMFGFSRLTWAWSVGAEVFALNNLLLAVLLMTAVCFGSSSLKDRPKISKVGAFLCGLCLTNQHTSVVYVAFLALWVLFSLHRDLMLSLSLLLQLTVLFSAGLLPYLYLPLSALSRHAHSTWGDQSSFSGFFIHLLRREYGTLDLLKDHKGRGLFRGVMYVSSCLFNNAVILNKAYIEHVASDLSPAILFFVAMIFFSLYNKKHKGQRQVMLIFLAMLTVYSGFFAWRANLDIGSPLFLGVVERFWMQSDLVLTLLAAVAFHDVVSIVTRRLPVQDWHLDTIFVILLMFFQVRLNLPLCDKSGNFVVHDFAVTSLSAFPQGSVVLTEGDLPSNSFRYFHLVELVRPDLTIIDQEMLTYDWFIPMLGHHLPGLVLPGNQMFSHGGISVHNKKLFTFQQLLNANYDRKPLYGCIGVQDHEPSWKESYELRPFGVCVQFVKKGNKFKLEEWLKASQNFSTNWTHPIPESDSSWEDVASSEMWRAKHFCALQILISRRLQPGELTAPSQRVHSRDKRRQLSLLCTLCYAMVRTVAGLHLMEQSEHMKEQHRKVHWLRKAHQVYKEAIESHKTFPAYWHKNFALVCDKLRHFSNHSEKINLVQTSIIHFKAYLNADVVDPEKKAIQNAIHKLQDYLDVLQKS